MLRLLALWLRLRVAAPTSRPDFDFRPILALINPPTPTLTLTPNHDPDVLDHSPTLVGLWRHNPDLLDDCYSDDVPAEHLDPDDVESWPAWTLIPTDLLDPDRFNDRGDLHPRPVISFDRGQEGGRS